MKKRVIVGMSGGIDSSVSAFLLKEKGYEVIGVFMKIWNDQIPINLKKDKPSCYGPEEKDIEDAKKVAEFLNIPFYLIDVRKEYKEKVFDYFLDEYIKGKTPNPCVICNRFIKFGYLIEKAVQSGIKFDYFATGHYAIVEYDKKNGRYLLKKALDRKKDQSYFLYLLNQKQLSFSLFPLGKYRKEKVREIAKKYKIPVSEKSESQDFISGDRFPIFENYAQKGPIIDKKGNVLGYHKGIMFYTIGQRKGLGISFGKPLYVIGILPEKNSIVVGEKKDCYKDTLIAKNLNFISVEKLEKPMEVKAKIRYASKESKAVVYPIGKDIVEVKFSSPQWAVTPGQSVIFYKKDIVIGGGIIINGDRHFSM